MMNVVEEREELWRVGDLARRTGVSVRTLHYYDEIGLLSPSRHSEGKHRLYGSDDVVRLQQIRSLQQMKLCIVLLVHLVMLIRHALSQTIVTSLPVEH